MTEYVCLGDTFEKQFKRPVVSLYSGLRVSGCRRRQLNQWLFCRSYSTLTCYFWPSNPISNQRPLIVKVVVQLFNLQLNCWLSCNFLLKSLRVVELRNKSRHLMFWHRRKFGVVTCENCVRPTFHFSFQNLSIHFKCPRNLYAANHNAISFGIGLEWCRGA